MTGAWNEPSLSGHPRVAAFLADGDVHHVTARLDASATEITLRRRGSRNDLDTVSTEHVSDALLQNLADAAMRLGHGHPQDLAIRAENGRIVQDGATFARSAHLHLVDDEDATRAFLHVLVRSTGVVYVRALHSPVVRYFEGPAADTLGSAAASRDPARAPVRPRRIGSLIERLRAGIRRCFAD